jgi:4'-phosphopantetheinyl transferase
MECPAKSRLDQGQRPMMNSATEWEVPSSIPSFAASDIHIWRASLDLSAPALARLDATLGHDEKSRAGRFVHARDRDHFIAARGILRDLLGAYLKQPADRVQFRYGKHGKPRLAAEYSETAITFNLSHSHGLAVYAISNGLELGIDVELIRPEFAGEDIAARYFSEEEMAELRALPIELRADGFFRCWTRKEAYVKARGEGLSIPLDSFSVSLTPGQPDVLSSVDSESWTLRSFAPEPRYVGAVVGHGQNLRFSHLAWRE